LIEISDVTRTVYISFEATAAASSERLQPVVRNVFPCSNFVTIPLSRDTAEKFEGGQIALSLIRYC